MDAGVGVWPLEHVRDNRVSGRYVWTTRTRGGYCEHRCSVSSPWTDVQLGLGEADAPERWASTPDSHMIIALVLIVLFS
jgi:hypothetical protein